MSKKVSEKYQTNIFLRLPSVPLGSIPLPQCPLYPRSVALWWLQGDLPPISHKSSINVMATTSSTILMNHIHIWPKTVDAAGLHRWDWWEELHRSVLPRQQVQLPTGEHKHKHKHKHTKKSCPDNRFNCHRWKQTQNNQQTQKNCPENKFNCPLFC